ncbi:MAG: site-specific DNA-methyltransferase, partial [Candidatus Poribacteria bacterium]
MYLQYKGKKAEVEILKTTNCANLVGEWDGSPNKLIQGDNLPVLKALLETYNMKGKVDLVYIDPPFSTGNKFTIGDDRVSTISNSYLDDIAYSDNLTGAEFIEFL